MNSNPGPSTAQLDAWRGAFGDAYVERNDLSAEMLAARGAMWARILKPVADAMPDSILEVGANIGINLTALKFLTAARLVALEPNAGARKLLKDNNIAAAADIHEGFASAIPLTDGAVDMAFTSGVLIHISPDDLLASCREIHRVSARYIACIEYFSDTPQEIRYRNQEGLLFKRDFGEFWMLNFADLSLVDYGFFWRRATGLDNLTWWLFCKD
jgi:pseudaminic acid biosynthesis-associated methylase